MDIAVAFVKRNGFDWDDANVYKVCRHGLSVGILEDFFSRKVLIIPDTKHSGHETRVLAFGKSHEGRYMLAVYTMRHRDQLDLLRVITARYIHKKEIRYYEEVKEAIEN